MTHLIRELIYCKSDERFVCEIGTPVYEPRPSSDPDWNEELKYVEARCRELNRENRDAWLPMIILGGPRCVPRDAIDANWKPVEKAAPAIAAAPPVAVEPKDEEPDEGPQTFTPATLPASCGVVVLVDTMNLLVKAWHAGQPSNVHAVKSVLLTMAHVLERLPPAYVVFALDGGYAERSRLLPDYKAHRKPKPEGFDEQKQLFEKAIDAIGWPGIRCQEWEADDVIASLVEQLKERAASIVVASSDKDLLQLIPSARVYHPWGDGVHWNAAKVLERHGVKPDQIADYLALKGDESDGVPGCPGIGEKRAADLLRDHATLEGIIAAATAGKISGAVGKNVVAGAEAARLSRRVIELNRKLDIPAEWVDWPATEPRAGWIDELRKLGLGECVQKLFPYLSHGRPRQGSSSIELSVGTSAPVEVKTVRVECGDDGLSYADRAQRNLARAIATDLTDPDWVTDFPQPCELPHDIPYEIALMSCYAHAWQQLRAKRESRFVNVWRWGTDRHFVTDLALSGLSFALPAPFSQIKSPEPERPVRSQVKSLF